MIHRRRQTAGTFIMAAELTYKVRTTVVNAAMPQSDAWLVVLHPANETHR
jgi:hypothetical protein